MEMKYDCSAIIALGPFSVGFEILLIHICGTTLERLERVIVRSQ